MMRNVTHSITRAMPWTRPFSLMTLGLGMLPALASVAHAQLDFYPTGGIPRDIVAADMNGDGRTDLIVADEDYASLYVLLNNGDGTFAEAWRRNIRIGQSLAIGDVDGDYDLDIVVGGWEQIGIFYNRGDGTIEREVRAATQSTQQGVTAIAIADFDGDGLSDIVAAINDNNFADPLGVIYWYRNVNNESFERMSFLNGGSCNEVTSLAVGDFDDDGDMDVASTNYIFPEIWRFNGYEYLIRGSISSFGIMLNNGDGSEWQRGQIRLPGGDFDGPPSDLNAGDLDGDGDLDLIALMGGTNDNDDHAEVLWQTAPGQFELGEPLWSGNAGAPGGMTIGDFDHDGRLDFVMVPSGRNTLVARFHQNLGNDQFNGIPINDENIPARDVDSTTLADVDGNGSLDIISTTDTPSLGVFVYRHALYPTPFTLSQGDLVRGEITTFRAEGVPIGQVVSFYYSLNRTGNSRGQSVWGGMTIDLIEPFNMVGYTLSNRNGVAQLQVRIPPQTPLVDVATQAIVALGTGGENSIKSNFIVAPVRDQ